MQNYIYQICLLFSEIGKNKTENSQRLISNTQTLFSKLRGAYKYHVAIELIKERKKWLYLLNEIAPIAYSSPCNSKVKFLFWLATSPIARNFVVALIFIPAAIYLFPKTLYHNLNNLRAKIKAHFDQKTDVNEKSENTILELMKSGIEVNTSKGMLLKIMAHSNQKTDVNEISENNILELMKSGIEVDTSKGMLFMLSGYKSSSLYPLKKYLYDEGLDKQDFVIFINHPNLSAVFQNTNKRYPIYSIYGASVVDKDKEIAIYTEIYKNFTNVDEQLSKIQYNGIPIASFMLTNFFTSAATAAATKEAFKYCKSINRNNVIFVTRGDDVFQDSILRDICEDERNNLNKFYSWKVRPIYDPFEDVKIEYENPKTLPRFKHFGFRNVNTFAKIKFFSEKDVEKLRNRIEPYTSGKGILKKARALIYEIRSPYHYLSAAIQYHGKQSETDSIFVVTEAEPKSIYWKAVYPVIQSIRAKSGKVVVFTGNYSVYVKMRAENIEVFLLSAIIAMPPSLETNQEMNKLFMEFSSFIQFEMNSERDKDYKYFDPKDMHIMFNSLKELGGLYGGFKHSMMLIDMLSQAFDIYKPRSILCMPHASPGPAHAIDIAKMCGVTSVSMPSVTVDGNRRSIPINWKTDIIASYGEQCNKAFLETGHNEEALVLTGNASLDSLLLNDVDISEIQVRTDLGIDNDMKIILIATSRIDTQEEVWLNAMHDHCESRGDAVVVIKSHPSFDSSCYDGVRKSKYCIIVEDIPIYSLIYTSTMLVTDYSTTGVEAALVGKPVVVVNLLGKEYPSNNYEQYGVALLINELSKVPEVLDPLLDGDVGVIAKMDSAREKFVDNYNYLNDGHASDRIADILLNPDKYTAQDKVGEIL